MWQPYADELARQVHGRIARAISRRDLESIAREALWRMARRFDPSRGVPFIYSAKQRVEGALIDALQLRRIRVRYGRVLGTIDRLNVFLRGRVRFAERESLREEHAAWLTTWGAISGVRAGGADAVSADARSPEDHLTIAQQSATLDDVIEALEPREAELIKLLYFGEATLDEAGLLLGLSKSWLSRLHVEALASLRRSLIRAVPPALR
ncbi:FliA/WhiG family RNA polymerase sigma factor [soil metagenome]